MSQRLAIATTLRNADAVLDSFITYHRAVGFDHLFLFFDDPDDPALPRAQAYANVTVIPHDDRLRQRWRASTLFATRFPNEVMGRQILNLEVAIQLALERRFDWILHIDSDELFYTAHQPVNDHFADLAARNIQGVKYPNYEAVPEQVDVVDYFKSITLFKRSLFDIARLKGPQSPRLTPRYTAQQKALVATIPQIPPTFFHFYRKGKSAARVSRFLRPFGVHDFNVPHGPVAYATAPDAPVILHYTCCGFEHFWTKFANLAQTYAHGVETWWGKDVTHIFGSFYRDARDVVGRGDKQEARAFYEQRYVLSDEAHRRALLDHNLCRRVLEPAGLLTDDERRLSKDA